MVIVAGASYYDPGQGTRGGSIFLPSPFLSILSYFSIIFRGHTHHCFRIYDASAVDTFLKENDGKETALCPVCITDTIIGDASGFNFTDELIDILAYEYLHGLTRGELDGKGPIIVELE